MNSSNNQNLSVFKTAKDSGKRINKIEIEEIIVEEKSGTKTIHVKKEKTRQSILGFGGAFTAVADDASALYYNCAGLAGIETIKLHATRISHLGALVNYDFLAGILPVGQIGTFGISTDGIRDKEDIYQERQIKVAYAKSFGEKILVCISFKTLRTAYNIKTESVRENPYFSIYETANFSTDIGLLIIQITLNFILLEHLVQPKLPPLKLMKKIKLSFSED